MVHSVAIWNDVLEVGTAEKKMKTRSLIYSYQEKIPLKIRFYVIKSTKPAVIIQSIFIYILSNEN